MPLFFWSRLGVFTSLLGTPNPEKKERGKKENPPIQEGVVVGYSSPAAKYFCIYFHTNAPRLALAPDCLRCATFNSRDMNSKTRR